MKEADETTKTAELLLNCPDDTRVPTRTIALQILNKLGIPYHFLRLPSAALFVDGQPGKTVRLYSEPKHRVVSPTHVSDEEVTVGKLKEIAAGWINDSIGLTVSHLGGTNQDVIGWQLADREGNILDAATNPLGLWSHEVLRGEAVTDVIDRFGIAGEYRLFAALEGDIEEPEFIDKLDISIKMS
ncbi:hypothetical protein [Roseibium sp. RKSG952]|uniref:hypothetical protein n=1 Tax=Roseibium sp. RKSG952 TaxID=2529384 RepID=UPI0012BCC77B|nr:hypothetical protein [Roseibium sp. RKSG952]MTH94666.1 hypothetical protein [Roseibium sp. RKSG952]